jgi:hypothetical protein
MILAPTITIEKSDEVQICRVVHPLANLKSTGAFYNSPVLSDVNILCQEKVFMAHRLILSCQLIIL